MTTRRHEVPLACRWAGWVLLALALAAHAALVLLVFEPEELPGCGTGSACAAMLHSPWSSIAGWPVAFIGLACVVGTAFAWTTVEHEGISRFLKYLARLAALVALAFVGIMVHSRQYCPYCLAAHGLSLAFWVLVEALPGRTRASLRGASLFAVGFSLVSAVLVVVQAERRWSMAETSRREPSADSPVATSDSLSAPSKAGASAGLRGYYRRGPDTAPFHVVLFSDYSCTFCVEVEQQLSSIVERNKNVSLSLKHYPLCTDCNPAAGTNLHPNACRAALAAEAAGMVAGSDGFWTLHTWLFERQGEFSDDDLRAALPSLGLSEEVLQVMQEPETLRRVQADIKEAQALRVEGTPTVYANGTRLRYWDTEASLERQILASQRKPAPRPQPPAGETPPP